MKTIEIISGGQKAQFTTKSVTFDGKEFFYTNMSDLKNDPVRGVYTFTYDGEARVLHYTAEYARVLDAIFGQVMSLQAKKNTAPAQTAPAERPAPSQATAPAAPVSGPSAPDPFTTEQPASPAFPHTGGSAAASSAPAVQEPPVQQMADTPDTAADTDKGQDKKRFRKSILTFGIVLAVVVVLAVIMGFTRGTSLGSSPLDQTDTQTEQYYDIDEVIEEM